MSQLLSFSFSFYPSVESTIPFPEDPSPFFLFKKVALRNQEGINRLAFGNSVFYARKDISNSLPSFFCSLDFSPMIRIEQDSGQQVGPLVDVEAGDLKQTDQTKVLSFP